MLEFRRLKLRMVVCEWVPESVDRRWRDYEIAVVRTCGNAVTWGQQTKGVVAEMAALPVLHGPTARDAWVTLGSAKPGSVDAERFADA